MQGFQKYFIPAILAVLFAVMAVALLRPAKEVNSNTGNGTSLAGLLAPDFALTDLNGKKISLASLRGKPVVLNFWASWCEPCKDEAPMLSAASKALNVSGTVVLGIAYNDTQKAMQEFKQRYSLAFPLLKDSDNQVSVMYGLRGVPETFFINKKGEIVSRYFGPLNETILAQRTKAIQ